MGNPVRRGIEKGALSERGAPFSHSNQLNRRTIVTDSGTREQPIGEPKHRQADTPDTNPEEDQPITEDPDGTPKENPSGG